MLAPIKIQFGHPQCFYQQDFTKKNKKNEGENVQNFENVMIFRNFPNIKILIRTVKFAKT